MLAAAFLLLFLGGNRWVAMSLARSLEWRYLPSAEPQHADVLVLLGGGTLAADFPRSMVEINSAGDRVLYAAQLFHQGKVKHVLISGGFLGWSARSTSPAEDTAALLEILDIPREALWLEPEFAEYIRKCSIQRQNLTGKRDSKNLFGDLCLAYVPRRKAF